MRSGECGDEVVLFWVMVASRGSRGGVVGRVGNGGTIQAGCYGRRGLSLTLGGYRGEGEGALVGVKGRCRWSGGESCSDGRWWGRSEKGVVMGVGGRKGAEGWSW